MSRREKALPAVPWDPSWTADYVVEEKILLLQLHSDLHTSTINHTGSPQADAHCALWHLVDRLVCELLLRQDQASQGGDMLLPWKLTGECRGAVGQYSEVKAMKSHSENTC